MSILTQHSLNSNKMDTPIHLLLVTYLFPRGKGDNLFAILKGAGSEAVFFWVSLPINQYGFFYKLCMM